MKKLLFTLLLAPILFIGCKNEEDTEQDISIQSSAILYCADTLNIAVQAPNDYTIDYNSNYIDVIKKDNSLKVIAKYVGNVDLVIKTNGSQKTCNIDIKGKYNVYLEPLKLFGKTKQEIKDAETRTLYSELDNYLIYNGENHDIVYAAYNFDSTGMKATFSTHEYSSLLIPYQIKERYMPLFYQNSIYYYKSPDEKYLIAVDLSDSDGMVICCLENTQSKSTSYNIDIINAYINYNKKIYANL